MQMDEASQLRKEWKAQGNKECNHPTITKEYYLGTSTGDYVCTTCGQTRSSKDEF